MCTFYLHLYLSSWSLRTPLKTWNCLLFYLEDFYPSSFLWNLHWNLQQPKIDLWKVWWCPLRPICLDHESRIPWNLPVMASSNFKISTWWYGRLKQILSSWGQALKGWPRLGVQLSYLYHIVLAIRPLIWIWRSRLARIQRCLDSVKSACSLVDEPSSYLSSKINIEASPILHLVKSTHRDEIEGI